MTDQELRDLIASIAKMQAEAARQEEKRAEERRKIEEELAEIIAAVDIPDNLRAEVLKKGLYLARIHDGEFELLTPRGFRPATFGPAVKHNGKAKKRASARK